MLFFFFSFTFHCFLLILELDLHNFSTLIPDYNNEIFWEAAIAAILCEKLIPPLYGPWIDQQNCSEAFRTLNLGWEFSCRWLWMFVQPERYFQAKCVSWTGEIYRPSSASQFPTSVAFLSSALDTRLKPFVQPNNLFWSQSCKVWSSMALMEILYAVNLLPKPNVKGFLGTRTTSHACYRSCRSSGWFPAISYCTGGSPEAGFSVTGEGFAWICAGWHNEPH